MELTLLRLTPLAAGLSLVLLAACQRQATPEAAAPAIAPAPEVAAGTATPATPSLDDVIEHDPRYVVGISYPPGAAADPGLAQALHDYAQAARADLDQAVAALDGPPRAPYELSLGFRQTLRTGDVVAVAADGSLYTGGAHGMPLVERFAGEAHAANRDVPIFMAHGQGDSVIPHDFARQSAELLAAAGYPLEWRSYPMEHSLCLPEVRDIEDWLAKVLAA